jgi:hypothetical protein
MKHYFLLDFVRIVFLSFCNAGISKAVMLYLTVQRETRYQQKFIYNN